MALVTNTGRHVQNVISPYLGGDPELFIADKDGRVVGSERVIAEKGIPRTGTSVDIINGVTSGIVRDGVQAEIKWRADTCRASLGNEISLIFKTLKETLDKSGLQASFAASITVDKKELKQLSEAARVLGCAPSTNIHNADAKVDVKAGFAGRSAGGHIHLGLSNWRDMMTDDARKRLIKVMDVIVGNTCVLIDRDPGQVARRKVYGRAGEFRLPSHGVEYRTLSNFWLRSYQLFSLVMGLSRLSTNIIKTDLYYKNGIEGELMGRVNLPLIEKAINTNNAKLAWKNWEGVKDFIDSFVPPMECGIDTTTVDDFEFFAMKVQRDGLESWFPLDPITHWTNMPEGHGTGWEAYIRGAVGHVRQQDRLAVALQKIRDRK